MTRQTYFHQHRQHGAVSLFVVIFTTMLFVAVTVGFTILMLEDQRQATDSELAQSALDSAHAGTEDAKRVLSEYESCKEHDDPSSVCTRIVKAVDDQKCDTIPVILGEESAERAIRTTSNDDLLQQAYTCVKITINTEDYTGVLNNAADVRMIPLRGDAPFDTVRIDWMNWSHMGAETDKPNLAPLDDFADITSAERADYLRLPSQNDWIANHQGALLRVGAMQYDPANINLTTLNTSKKAAFLYSSATGTGNSLNTRLNMDTLDLQKPLTAPDQSDIDVKLTSQPTQVRCNENSTTYVCSTYLQLPHSDTPSPTRFLTLSSLYRNVDFRITLIDSSQPSKTILFDRVQPIVDTTGRANDVFRRVVSRIETSDASTAPYPRAAVTSGSSVCKDYSITDLAEDFEDHASLADCPNVTRP